MSPSTGGGELYVWLGSALVGLATAAAGVCAEDQIAAAFMAVQRDLADKLRRLRRPTRRLRAWLLAWLGFAVVVFFAFWFVWANIVFAVLIPTLLLAGPWYLVRRLAQNRRQKIEDQMADAMVALANAVRAGLSLPQSLEILATQCPDPIRTEFQQMVSEYKLGRPLERTLLEAKGRLESENFALFTAAMLASHESGGRLNETVERIARSVLEMQRLERKILSETAQARKSAVYMAIVPGVILVVYWFVDPANTELLFTHIVGQVLLGISLTLNLVAYVWARSILNPDI